MIDGTKVRAFEGKIRGQKKQKAARNFEQLSDVIHTISINPISQMRKN